MYILDAMKKFAWLIFFIGISLSTLYAQISPRLYINDTRVTQKAVEIDYDITYGGFVEIHLFDEDGKKLWIHGVVNKKLGTYTFRIPLKPLEPGIRYNYYFLYKGEEYHGSFYAG